MMVDVKKAVFRIVTYGESFAFIVRYEGRLFIAERGALPYLKPKFIQAVKDRGLLRPFLERALATPIPFSSPASESISERIM